jgi:hypothetical protein
MMFLDDRALRGFDSSVNQARSLEHRPDIDLMGRPGVMEMSSPLMCLLARFGGLVLPYMRVCFNVRLLYPSRTCTNQMVNWRDPIILLRDYCSSRGLCHSISSLIVT